MKKITFLILTGLLALSVTTCGETKANNTDNNNQTIKNMKLKITVGDVILTATLADNSTAKDFISLLPLTVKLDDYAGSEKIFYPERKLSTEGAGRINTVEGDITYYSPWGNIAIFYKDFVNSNSLIPIAKFEGNIDVLKGKESIDNVKFELIEE